MNFNNINGVWPQIKDYIDSKLGGGINKYKHMIYVQYLTTEDFTISPQESNGYRYIIRYPDLSNAWALIKDGKVKYGPIIENSLKLYGHKPIENASNWYYMSEVASTLPEGWYINYMGQIYDWKGNIVE